MKTATATAAPRIRWAFFSCAFSVSTNTHNADRVPRTPTVACARRIASLLERFKRSLLSAGRTLSQARENGRRIRQMAEAGSLSGRFLAGVFVRIRRFFTPGPIKTHVGVVLYLSRDGVPIAEQHLKS